MSIAVQPCPVSRKWLTLSRRLGADLRSCRRSRWSCLLCWYRNDARRAEARTRIEYPGSCDYFLLCSFQSSCVLAVCKSCGLLRLHFVLEFRNPALHDLELLFHRQLHVLLLICRRGRGLGVIGSRWIDMRGLSLYNWVGLRPTCGCCSQYENWQSQIP